MGASTSKVGLEKSQKTVIFWIFLHPQYKKRAAGTACGSFFILD
jgi:hypothetical protein